MDALAETLWREFAIETEDHLQAIEQILAGFEPGRLAADDVAQLFRSFHSVKGLARAMDLRGMETIAHHAENLLGLVREGRAMPDPAMADLLLQAVDALKLMRDAASRQFHDSPADPGLVARLASSFADAGGAADDVPAAPAAGPPAGPTPLHEDPEMLAIFIEMLGARGPELCAALTGDAQQCEAALEAAETLAHAAGVMNFDGLAASLTDFCSLLRPPAPAGGLTPTEREAILDRIAAIRLQLELLGAAVGRDAGATAFSAALAAQAADDRRGLVEALAARNRELRQHAIAGDNAGVKADAAAAARPMRILRAIAAALSLERTAEILLLVEDLYARISSGALSPSEGLSEAVDAFFAVLARRSDDLPVAEAAAAQARLRSLTQSAAQQAIGEDGRLIAGLRLPPELLATLTDESLAALEAGIASGGLRPYGILAHFEQAPEPASRILAWLHAEARPITNRTMLTDGESWFDILALSPLEPAAFVEALGALDPERRCIRRVRLFTDAAAGQMLLDWSAPATAGAEPGVSAPAVSTGGVMRVRGELIDLLLDEIGEFRVAAAALRHLIRGQGARALGHRIGAFAAGLSPELRREFMSLVRDARDRDRRLLDSEEIISGMLSRLHQNALELRVVPVDVVLSRLTRLVRDLARQHGKAVELVLEGRDVRIDKGMVDALADPLIHMVRNAVDHGIEPAAERRAAGKPERARLAVRAAQRGSEVEIEVADDGRGLDADAIRARAVARGLLSPSQAADLADEQIYQLIFEAGLSTAAAVTETSGRGVGMDVVLNAVRRLNGDITVCSQRGQGAAFTLVLPVSAALQTALIVRAAGQSLAIPERHVLSVAEIETDAIRLIGSHRSILHRQAVLPLYGLAELLGFADAAPAPHRAVEPIVIASNGRHMIGLEVDAIEQRQELFLKELDPLLAGFPGVGGASVLGDGRVVLVLDGDELIQIAARGVEVAVPARVS